MKYSLVMKRNTPQCKRVSVRAQQGDDTIFQDAAATFRSLKLGDAEPAEGEAANDDSSSSSSSNDDADVTLRMPASVVMQVLPLQRTISRAAHHETVCQDAALMVSIACFTAALSTSCLKQTA